MSSVFEGRATVEHPATGIEQRKRLAAGLCGLLADTYLLLVKTQAFHWNVVGPLFISLHRLTEEQYQDLFAAVDEIAERIRALGYPAPGSLHEMVAQAQISENAGYPTGDEMLAILAADHEVLAQRLRAVTEVAEELRDQVTADLLTARMAFHEKAIWMLRATQA